ncbi:MAG: hypothetical protein EXQ79_08715 [Acidimicrobiia bacterium]|nr:hypothetical protein [Acidimicrobiia bacterium]
MNLRRRLAVKPFVVVSVIVGFGLVGPSAALATRSTAATTVKITLFEYKIKLKGKGDEVPTGRVKFKIRNIGIEEHEVVIVRGDDPKALSAKDGVVDEAAIPDGDLVGESGEIKAKGSKSKSFTLDPGSYVLFCNVLHDHGHGDMGDMDGMEHGATSGGHFGEGMYTVITVG